MYSIPIPKLDQAHEPKNALGLTIKDYQGGLSTLCGGCGHDSITFAIIQAAYELSIAPEKFAKLSGIGCSSKTPGYFISKAHGINAVHGRMPSIASGANAAARNLHYLAVSGDGDSGSIGFGQFAHIIRRQINMLYIVENNGVYGLTKGQFSATSELGVKNKKGHTNAFSHIDLTQIAIQLGASFVARSFSGHKEQLIPLLKRGLRHPGFAFIDVLSPCVSFNNHKDSSKSYAHIRENEVTFAEIKDAVVEREAISIQDYDKESAVTLHDGSEVTFKNTDRQYDIHNKQAAMGYLAQCAEEGKIPTGMLFEKKQAQDFHTLNATVSKQLRDHSPEELLPNPEEFASLMASLR